MSVSPEPDINRAVYSARGGKVKRTVMRPRFRSCLLCSFVQSSPDWIDNGCPNCEEIIQAKGSQERIKQCTSLQFDGVIAMIKPDASWVARWQRIGPMVPGLYAARVIGRPPPDVLHKLGRRKIPYIPRDDVAADPKNDANARRYSDDHYAEEEDDAGDIINDEEEENAIDANMEEAGRPGGGGGKDRDEGGERLRRPYDQEDNFDD